jgi:molybdopterin converting factor small subunit
MTTVRVPTPLRPYTGGAKEVDVTGATVGAALLDLAQRYPDVQRHLFDESGALRSYVNVFVNDDDIRSLQGDATVLRPSDRVMIIPSIAGGIDVAEAPLVPVVAARMLFGAEAGDSLTFG